MAEVDLVDLATDVVRRLQDAGVPAGLWLTEIEEALASVDRVARTLRRLRAAVIRDLEQNARDRG
jgi:hypothetical protein